MTLAETIAAEDAAAAAEDAAYALAQAEALKPRCCVCGSKDNLSYRYGELLCWNCIHNTI